MSKKKQIKMEVGNIIRVVWLDAYRDVFGWIPQAEHEEGSFEIATVGHYYSENDNYIYVYPSIGIMSTGNVMLSSGWGIPKAAIKSIEIISEQEE